MNRIFLFTIIFSASLWMGEHLWATGLYHSGQGATPTWSSAKKVQVGTFFSDIKSNIWFTNIKGNLTETYFPTIDKAQIKDSRLLVSDGKTFLSDESAAQPGLVKEVKVVSASSVELLNTHKKFQVKHRFFTLPGRPTLVDEVEFVAKADGLKVYLLVNPHLNNTGYGDSGKSRLFQNTKTLDFFEQETLLRVYSDVNFDKTSLGFVGENDGHTDLKDNFSMNYTRPEVSSGNIAGTGKISIPEKKGTYRFFIVYDFSKDKNILKAKQLGSYKKSYDQSWKNYFNSLRAPSWVSKLNKNQKLLYDRSLYVLRVHEDKLNPGAMIASLSKPWGDQLLEKPGVFTGGYHLVWPRDLFHVSLAMLAAGDRDTALRALRFLKRIQYKSGQWNYGQRIIPKRGAWPQNVWMDGSEYWGGLQLDQVGYPVQLFAHLYKSSSLSEQKKLLVEFKGMLKMALNFIITYGPWSAQERWEENYGISPSSFSVAVAALKLGGEILDDDLYKEVAKGWLTKPNDNIHAWTFTKNGHYGGGEYYVRVAGCSDYNAPWAPDNAEHCWVANSGKKIEITEFLDQGFLKLSLMGLVPSTDWRILTSLKEINAHIRKPVGDFYAWHRYSHDAYGENKKGRLWPLLSSEHGRFEWEKYQDGFQNFYDSKKASQNILDSYLFYANDGLMIPEQIFAGSGEGTGAATPLAWSHAEFIKMLWSHFNQKNIENLLRK